MIAADGRVRPGDLLDGKYTVERELGQGGAGYVVAAHHVLLQRRVALKLLRPELAAEPELCRRFLREGQSAAKMTGEHVARVLDADTLSTGEPYLVMEYLEGEDLAKVLRRRGHLPVAEATDYALQACEALREAHALRIVHRDLKPANLFLVQVPEGNARIKVLDFGISKVLDDAEADMLTHSNQVLGSPHYMAPEQIRTPGEVDARTDVWALGATLFTLLSGQVPFGGRSMMEVCAALLCGPPPSITRIRPDVPHELEAVVLRCLRVDPADRYASATALADALSPFVLAPAASPVGEALVAPDAEAKVAAVEGGATGIALATPMLAPGVVTTRAEQRREGSSARRALVMLGVLVAAVTLAAFVVARAVASSPPGRTAGAVDARAQPAEGMPSAARTVERAATEPPTAEVPTGAARDRAAIDGGPMAVASAASRPSPPSPPPAVSAAAPVSVTAAASAAALAPPPAASAAPVSVTAAASATPAASASHAGTGPAPRVDCSEPFYIDSRGIKAIRRECL